MGAPNRRFQFGFPLISNRNEGIPQNCTPSRDPNVQTAGLPNTYIQTRTINFGQIIQPSSTPSCSTSKTAVFVSILWKNPCGTRENPELACKTLSRPEASSWALWYLLRPAVDQVGQAPGLRPRAQTSANSTQFPTLQQQQPHLCPLDGRCRKNM